MSIVPLAFASAEVRNFDHRLLPNAHARRSSAMLPDDYALHNGDPVVPEIWVCAETAVETDGSYYVERPSILDINPEAYVRFVPGENWDSVGFIWSPYVSQANSRYQLEGTALSSPVPTTTEYQVGKQLFNPDSMSFSDSVLTSNFNNGLDDAYAFTISLAMALKESGPQNLLTFSDSGYLAVIPTGFEACVGGRKFKVSIPQGPTGRCPIYLVLDVTPPTATLLAGFSPTTMYRGSSSIADRTTSFIFTMTGVFDLFSLDIFSDGRPKFSQIFARYASVLGG